MNLTEALQPDQVEYVRQNLAHIVKLVEIWRPDVRVMELELNLTIEQKEEPATKGPV